MGVRGYGWKSSAEGGVRGAEYSTQYPGARRRAGRGEEEKRRKGKTWNVELPFGGIRTVTLLNSNRRVASLVWKRQCEGETNFELRIEH